MSFDVAAYLAGKGYRARPASGGRELTYPCFFDCGETADSKKRKLYINPEEAFYDCKVCGASGGSYMLQKHFGDDPRGDTNDDPYIRRRILDWAADAGATMLGQRDDVLLYLMNERGLDYQTIVDRKIGFVGDGWSLTGELPGEFTRDQLATTGLVFKDGSKAGQDYFYRHLLIPVIARGHVIQIRARIWGDAKGGKYLSGPGEAVRAFNLDSLDGAEEVILTEGEFDAIRLHETLTTSSDPRARRIAVVGLPGTSAWPGDLDDRLSTVKRIFVGFDSDEPGRLAAEKLREKFGTRARILQLPYLDGRKCDWTEYLLPKVDDTHAWQLEHPYAGHTATDVTRLMSAAAGKRIHSIAESGAAFREYRSEHGGLQTGWSTLDAVLHPGLLPGQVVFLLAKTGCLAGDTVVQVVRSHRSRKMRLDTLVEGLNGRVVHSNGKRWDLSIPTYIQRKEDGVVRLAEITAGWASGELFTFTVTTHTGRKIRASVEHPFSTERGWVKLGDLTPGDLVHVNAGRSNNGHKPIFYSRRVANYHPHGQSSGAKGRVVPLHRLAAEAAMNGMDLRTFMDRVKNPDRDRTSLTFIDPATHVVHHDDHNPANNHPDNLRVLTHAEHIKLHIDEGGYRNCLERISTERVVSIKEHGWEPTYDLEVEGDPNYLANGFVVHNTGKTLLLCNLAYMMRQHRILFISLEMTREEVYHRLERVYWFHHPEASTDDLEAALANIWICDENRLAERDISALVSEYEMETGQKPEVVFVDYLGYYARGMKGNSPYEKVTAAAMQLKADAKAGRLVIIAPTQVNRVAKDGKPIDLDDARDSGAIEETGDFVLAAFRPDNAMVNQSDAIGGNRAMNYKLKLSVLKSRHGGVGTVVSLLMDRLTLAIIQEPGPSSRRAEDHNRDAERGLTWEDLRRQETAPVQQSLKLGGRR